MRSYFERIALVDQIMQGFGKGESFVLLTATTESYNTHHLLNYIAHERYQGASLEFVAVDNSGRAFNVIVKPSTITQI